VSQKTSPTFEEGLSDFNIFDTNIPDTTGHQMTIQFPTSTTSVSALLGKTKPTKYYIFMQGSIITYSK